MGKTLYDVIGVSQDADVKQIEARCLELGKKYHPKTNPDDLEAAIIYKDIMTAYMTLRDPAKRVSYDASIKSNVVINQSAPKGVSSSLTEKIEAKVREVNVYLAGAIVVFPHIFSWFLLRKGYSTKARMLSFGWMAIWLLVFNAYQNITPEERAAMAAKRETQKIAEQKAEEEKANSDEALKLRIMSSWKGAIKEVLIDPDSAKFERVVYVMSKNRIPFACGEVNSRNSYGGYTGFKSFITAGLKEYTFLEGETKDFNKLWKEYCVNGTVL